jgi:hypothetical protein
LSLDRRALIASGAILATNIAVGPAMARAAKALYPADGDMVMGSAKARRCSWWFSPPPAARTAPTGGPRSCRASRRPISTPARCKLVFREFLTEPPSFAAAGFLLSRSVPGKYFEVLGTVFAKQAEIYQSGKLYEGLLAIGKSFGLTEAQFAAALSDKTTLEALNARVELAAVRDKVDVTPTFFVAGKHMPDDVSPRS